MALDIDRQDAAGRAVLRVKGEVDLNTSPAMRSAVLLAVKQGNDLMIDLSGVLYMDSSGVATLVEGLQASNGKHRRFTLSAPSSAVMKVLQLSRLDMVFDIQDT